MAEKKILSIECEIPGGLSEFASIDSALSLLDYDIILFRPDIRSLILRYSHTYRGKPSLSDFDSSQLRERLEHWHREISDALYAGKTILVFLPELDEVYIDTGERQYSGTGVSRRTTTIIAAYDNYRCLPTDVKLVNSTGSAMRLAEGAEILASYWSEFQAHSSYKVHLEGKVSKPLVVTETGARNVGALIRLGESAGAVLLLPHLDLESDDFYRETEEEEQEWTEKGQQFGRRLLAAIIEIDKSLRESRDITPTPEWARSPHYDLPRESRLREELLKVDDKIDELQKRREDVRERIATEGTLRRLLFEKGPPLEEAILEALKLMGFSADNYKDSDSEFDAVFESKEGRFLGEAEGKDNKAVGIRKLRQLEMNIHEDLDREEIDEPAKGVLFADAYRLSPLRERNSFFTDKCLKAAKRSGTALVRTPDLFVVAQYLSKKKDGGYAKNCRRALIEANGGVVQFPKAPRLPKGRTDAKSAE